MTDPTDIIPALLVAQSVPTATEADRKSIPDTTLTQLGKTDIVTQNIEGPDPPLG